MKGIRTIAFLAVLALLVAMPGAPAAGAAPAPTPTPLFKVGIQAGHWPEAGAPSCHDAYSNDPAYKDYTVGETTINHAVRDKVIAILRDVLGPHYQVDALNGDGGKDDVPKNYAADAFLALHCEWCETQNELNAGYKVSRYKGTFAKEGKDGSGDGSDRLVDLVWEHYGPATGLSRDKQSGHYTRNMLEYYGVANLAQGTPGAIIEMGWLYRDYTVLSDASKDGGQDDMARGLANAVLDLLTTSGSIPGDDAAVASQSDLLVAYPGEARQLELTLENVGQSTWKADAHYSLGNGGNPWAAPARQELSGDVAPGQSMHWTWRVQAPATPGVHRSTWRMDHGDYGFGPTASFHIIVVPEKARELREALEKRIAEWRKQGERKVDELITQLQQEIERWIREETEKRAKQFCPQVTGLLLLPVLLAFWRRR